MHEVEWTFSTEKKLAEEGKIKARTGVLQEEMSRNMCSLHQKKIKMYFGEKKQLVMITYFFMKMLCHLFSKHLRSICFTCSFSWQSWKVLICHFGCKVLIFNIRANLLRNWEYHHQPVFFSPQVFNYCFALILPSVPSAVVANQEVVGRRHADLL